MTIPTLSAGPTARARNGVIGRAGRLPWRLGTDLANFRAVTTGNPVIMGRKTWDSLPRRPLAGRVNLVLSRDAAFAPDGAAVCAALDDALVLGQARAAQDGASEVVLPPIDERAWHEVRREAHAASARDEYPFVIRVLERVSRALG